MRRIITFSFTAVGTKSLKADQDYLIQDVTCTNSQNAVVSFDPSLTTASFGGDKISFGMMIWKLSGNSSSMTVFAAPLSVLWEKDQVLYVATAATNSVQIFVDTLTSDTIDVDGKTFARAQ